MRPIPPQPVSSCPLLVHPGGCAGSAASSLFWIAFFPRIMRILPPPFSLPTLASLCQQNRPTMQRRVDELRSRLASADPETRKKVRWMGMPFCETAPLVCVPSRSQSNCLPLPGSRFCAESEPFRPPPLPPLPVPLSSPPPDGGAARGHDRHAQEAGSAGPDAGGAGGHAGALGGRAHARVRMSGLSPPNPASPPPRACLPASPPSPPPSSSPLFFSSSARPQNEDVRRKMAEIRADPELQPMFEDMQKNGPMAMLKYMNNPTVGKAGLWTGGKDTSLSLSPCLSSEMSRSPPPLMSCSPDGFPFPTADEEVCVRRVPDPAARRPRSRRCRSRVGVL